MFKKLPNIKTTHVTHLGHMYGFALCIFLSKPVVIDIYKFQFSRISFWKSEDQTIFQKCI